MTPADHLQLAEPDAMKTNQVMIKQIESFFQHPLPEIYKAFLESGSVVQEDEVRLYAPEEIIERNECYETRKYAPGYISIGDDSGGMAFIIPLKANDPQISVIGHGCMDPAFKEAVSPSFSQWQASGFQYEIE